MCMGEKKLMQEMSVCIHRCCLNAWTSQKVSASKTHNLHEPWQIGTHILILYSHGQVQVHKETYDIFTYCAQANRHSIGTNTLVWIWRLLIVQLLIPYPPEFGRIDLTVMKLCFDFLILPYFCIHCSMTLFCGPQEITVTPGYCPWTFVPLVSSSSQPFWSGWLISGRKWQPDVFRKGWIFLGKD